MATAEDVIWTAGFFDGEGTVVVSGSSCSVRAGISNTSLASLEWLQETFGGSLSYRDLPSGKEAGWWYVSGEDAILFLELIYPYLRVKKQVASFVLKYEGIFEYHGKPLPADVRSRREEVAIQVKQANV